jgi:hypothetical protein
VPDSIYSHGLLGAYELRQIDLLRDVFLWAYEKSSARYVAVRQTLGDPDPFRLKHRDPLRTVIAEIITSARDQIAATEFIRNWTADHIGADEQTRFIEVVETELLSLHDGNFARYLVRPREFQAWLKVWKGTT